MAIRVVDGTDTHIVQKVYRIIKGVEVVERFQTIERDRVGKAQADHHTTLRLAREAIGKTISAPSNETAPKSAYPEQQKGYMRPSK